MAVVDVDLLARAQHAVDGVLPQGVRVEVLDGLLVVNPPPSLSHGEVTLRLATILAASAGDDVRVNPTGIGVYEHDDAGAEYQIPDVTVYRSPGQRAGDRLIGADVELVAEVVSPANRRTVDYESAVVRRAVRYGIAWVLIVDPAQATVRWWHRGVEQAHGPAWAAGVDVAALFDA